jgi:succinyl-diaminopimelate desuccinylase
MTTHSTRHPEQIAPPIESIVALTRDLVAIPSSSGEESCQPMIDRVANWLAQHDISVTVLYSNGGAVGVVGEVTGTNPGPTYCLNACLDTAPFGDLSAWDAPPTEPRVVGGWLYGRGSADSKVAVAIFSHLASEFQRRRRNLAGRLLLLFDADEHSGRFEGVKTFLRYYAHIDGVMIGYPGNYGVIVGARGFYRASVMLYGVGGHSGGRRKRTQNAIEKAAELVCSLASARIPTAVTDAFPLVPSITVTRITGGSTYSMVPDRCEVHIDIRLTPAFNLETAQRLLRNTVETVDASRPGTARAVIEDAESWPPYRLPDSSRVASAMLTAARTHLKPDIHAVICGPSNIGNYFAAHRIDATCGFGVTYENIHAPNERIRLDTIGMTHNVYESAVRSLLAPEP